MSSTQRQTLSHLRDTFQALGFHPSTRLGQNFLVDLNLHRVFLNQAGIKRTDLVIEVGAGLEGALGSGGFGELRWSGVRVGVGPFLDGADHRIDLQHHENAFDAA